MISIAVISARSARLIASEFEKTAATSGSNTTITLSSESGGAKRLGFFIVFGHIVMNYIWFFIFAVLHKKSSVSIVPP